MLEPNQTLTVFRHFYHNIGIEHIGQIKLKFYYLSLSLLYGPSGARARVGPLARAFLGTWRQHGSHRSLLGRQPEVVTACRSPGGGAAPAPRPGERSTASGQGAPGVSTLGSADQTPVLPPQLSSPR